MGQVDPSSPARSVGVRAHRLRDFRLEGWQQRIAGRWSYRELANDAVWRDGWISFDALCWNPDDRNLYCGLNSIDGDLLYAFDRKSGTLQSLGARQWADELDVKIHRTLLRSVRRVLVFRHEPAP